MTQNVRCEYLIRYLLNESEKYQSMGIPQDDTEQEHLLRSLLNVRPPDPVGINFLEVQDAYLQEEIRKKGVTDIVELKPIRDNLYLWRGDITALKVDTIVNAANSQMLGCFVPCHACIDNAIHTYAGVQLRLACHKLMQKQSKSEPTGTTKITPAFNLPSKFILHTAGPIISGKLTKKDCDLLASCYHTCLALAEQNGIASIAFCCISTGEFHFPNERAAEIALQTVEEYLARAQSKMKVIFNVFKEGDYDIYKRLLHAN